MKALLLLVACLVGCKDKDKAKEPPAAPAAAPADLPSTRTPPPAAMPAPDAAADERCANPCRFLADTPLADIAAKVKSTCNAEWPAASGKDCAQLDYQRNCIYAAAGYTFKKKRYQAAFGSEPWYKARADFKDSDLSKTGASNITALKAQAADCRKSSTIEPKDKKIVDAWLAKLRAGKPEVPAIVFDGATADGTATLDEVKKRLVEQKADFAPKKLNSMTYRDQSGVRDEWAKAFSGKPVRIVELDFSDSGSGDCGDAECGYGLWLILAIDDKDQVVALEEGMAACPFAYLMTERGPVLQGELIRNLAGAERETTQALPVTASCGGRLTFRVAEEKSEVTYLDELVLVVDGNVIEPVDCGALCANDGRAQVLRPGDHLDVAFDTPPSCLHISLRSNGHYTAIRQ